MIDGKLINHKDKDFVTMKTYKEVKAVSEQNARFISKSGTLFRTKVKLYCTAATSCEETKRSVLDAFTIYATGSLDLIFLICSSLIGSRHQCTLKSLLSGLVGSISQILAMAIKHVSLKMFRDLPVYVLE